jgi:hypothetical protein
LLSFSPLVDYHVPSLGVALAVTDLDGDGLLDIGPVGSGGYPGINALFGNGDGSFRNAQLQGIGTRYTPVAADLNGDAIDDLVKIDDYLDLHVQLGIGDGTYRETQLIELPSRLPPGATGQFPSQLPTSMTLGDLNADGKLDLVVAAYDEEVIDPGVTSRQDDYVNVLLGNGDGTFGSSSAYHITSNPVDQGTPDGWPHLLGWRDFDGDHRADILVTTADAVRLFPGNGDGTLRTPLSVFQGSWTTDVNADGRSDRVDLAYQVYYSGDAPDHTTRSVHVRLGRPDRSFAAEVISDLGTTFGDSYVGRSGLADFDGDGYPELVVSESRPSAVPYCFSISVAHNDGIWTPPPPAITVSDVTITEGHSGTKSASFVVTLSGASTQPVSVAYTTANGTATAGSDYKSASGTLIIPAGQTTGTVSVLVNGDRVGEPNETFFVNLSSPANATIADGQAVGTIVDDEPRISITDVTRAEGRKNQTTQFTFIIMLSAAYDQPVTVSFQTVDGTATSGDNDYVAKTGTLTFAPGETTKTITIDVKGDSKKEADERFYLDLVGNSSNSVLDKKRGIGTILNDD